MDDSDLLALLLLTAASDRTISDEEKAALFESPRRWNASRETLLQARAKVKAKQFAFERPKTSQEALEALAKLASIVVVDGKVEAAEMAMLLRLTVAWNVDGAELADILVAEWSKRPKS